MTIRFIAIIFLLIFAYTQAERFMKKKEAELNPDFIKSLVELRTGDIIVKKEGNDLSNFLSLIDNSKYSSMGIVLRINSDLKVVYLDFDEENDSLKIEDLKSYVNFAKKIAIYRYEDEINSSKLFDILDEFKTKDIKLDYNFELNSEKFYNTRFVNEVFLKLFDDNLYLYIYDFYDLKLISIASIIKNPKLKKRFELEF